MIEVERYRFADPDESTAGLPCQKSEFVRATEFEAERELRMKALASLMVRDLEIGLTHDRIRTLEAQAASMRMIIEAVASVQNRVKNARSCIDDIRHGCNVTSDDVWSACEQLDKALNAISTIETLIAQVPSENPVDQRLSSGR